MPMIKTTWWNFHSGVIPTEKQKPISYSLVYPNGVVVCTGNYALCNHLKKQHSHAVIKPNFK